MPDIAQEVLDQIVLKGSFHPHEAKIAAVSTSDTSLQSKVTSVDSQGFRLLQQAALETLSGPEVTFAKHCTFC